MPWDQWWWQNETWNTADIKKSLNGWALASKKTLDVNVEIDFENLIVNTVQIPGIGGTIIDFDDWEQLAGSNGDARKKVVSDIPLRNDAELVVYPNPSSQQINIGYPFTPNTNYKVSLLSMSGRLVTSGDYQNPNGQISIDVSGLEYGMYVLRVESDQSAPASTTFIKGGQ